MDPDRLNAEQARVASLLEGDGDDRELVELFGDACGRLARLLAAALEAGDDAMIRQHADAIAGVADAVGLPEAARLAASARDGDARLAASPLLAHLMGLLQTFG